MMNTHQCVGCNVTYTSHQPSTSQHLDFASDQASLNDDQDESLEFANVNVVAWNMEDNEAVVGIHVRLYEGT
jgi:hypothetical protein